TMFFFAGGLNDHDLPTATSIGNLTSQVRSIYELGGRYFMIALLPTKIPAFAGVATRLNPAIGKLPGELRAALPEIHIELSRWGNYFDQVMMKPSAYGIINTTDRCAGRA